MNPIHTQSSASALTGADQYDACAYSENAFTRINEIMMAMKKMNIEMRDTLREFHDGMQKIAFDKELLSLRTKQDALDLGFSSSMTGAITQIVSGAVGFGGALTGSQIGSSATMGLGKVSEGIGGVVSAGESLEAKEAQILGEFQSEAADVFAKNIAATAERAAEASRQLRDTTRELNALYERMANAVQLRVK